MSTSAARRLRIDGVPREGGGDSANRSSSAKRSARRRTVSGSGGRKYTGTCPCCGKTKLDVTPDRNGNEHRPCYVGCFNCCPPDSDPKQCGDFIRALVAEIDDCPSGSHLLADPLRYLMPYLNDGRRIRKAVDIPLPTSAAIARWQSRLWAKDEGPRAARRFLRKRGISNEVIRDAKIGWDGDRQVLVFPMYRKGELVAVQTRVPRKGYKMRNWEGKGRPWPLCPEPRPGGTLLCEGVPDALRAISAGLNATSVTLGAGTWRAEWAEDLAGRRVTVCFDVGAEVQAQRAVRRLREAGGWARRLDLRKLGVTGGKDDNDLSDYLNNGGSVAALRRAASGRRREKEAA